MGIQGCCIPEGTLENREPCRGESCMLCNLSWTTFHFRCRTISATLLGHCRMGEMGCALLKPVLVIIARKAVISLCAVSCQPLIFPCFANKVAWCTRISSASQNNAPKMRAYISQEALLKLGAVNGTSKCFFFS